MLSEYITSELHKLPPDVAWSFINRLHQPWRWEYCGTRSSGYYQRQYARESPEWARVCAMLRGFFGDAKATLTPVNIFAVCMLFLSKKL
jgi:hypothetical protein